MDRKRLAFELTRLAKSLVAGCGCGGDPEEDEDDEIVASHQAAMDLMGAVKALRKFGKHSLDEWDQMSDPPYSSTRRSEAVEDALHMAKKMGIRIDRSGSTTLREVAKQMLQMQGGRAASRRTASDFDLRKFAKSLQDHLGRRVYDDLDVTGSRSFQIHGTGGNWDKAYDKFNQGPSMIPSEADLVVTVRGDYDERKNVLEVEVEAFDPDSYDEETLGKKKFTPQDWDTIAITLSDVSSWVRQVTD